MPGWFLPALLASFAIAGHYLLLRAASGKLGDTLGALILELVASLGIALYFVFGPKGESVPTSRNGILFAALSGLCISGASILLFAALRRGGGVASTGTIVLGGGVTLSAALAPIFFGEVLTVRRGIGVVLGILAIVLLSKE